MVCPDTLDLGLPLPTDILDQRLADFYCYAAETREIREDEDRARRSAMRRKMLRISREACPSTRNRARRRSRSEHPFKTTAYHEAGHAIAAAALGIPIGRVGVLSRDEALVHLHPDQESFFGRPICQGIVSMNHDCTDLRASIVGAFLAATGPAAEILGGGSATSFLLDPDPNEGGDARQMFDACLWAVAHHSGDLSNFTRDTPLLIRVHDRVWSLACHFVSDHRAIQAIESVAEQLRDHSSIRGAEVEHIAKANGVQDISALDELCRVLPGRLAHAA